MVILVSLNCTLLYAFTNINPRFVGYFNYGFSWEFESRNTYHTLRQDLIYFNNGLHIVNVGVKINPDGDNIFQTGYRFSLLFFSLGANVLFRNQIYGISPSAEVTLPMLLINLKLFFNYNIYFSRNSDRSNSPEFGFMVGVINFLNSRPSRHTRDISQEEDDY